MRQPKTEDDDDAIDDPGDRMMLPALDSPPDFGRPAPLEPICDARPERLGDPIRDFPVPRSLINVLDCLLIGRLIEPFQKFVALSFVHLADEFEFAAMIFDQVP